VSDTYRVKQFATMVGVTVRTLHHYDRLGLLKPDRTSSGYRIYNLKDLERLEQIVALKYLGIPLKQIRQMIQRSGPGLHQALRMQRRVLEEKRRMLDGAIGAIHEAEKAESAGGEGGAQALRKIIEVIEMQDNLDWTKKYYSEEAQAKVEERKKLWSPELQERVSREWNELFRDVEAARSEDPASAKSQALAARWMKLIEEFTGGDRQITSGLSEMHQDRANWPPVAQERMKPFSDPKVFEYIQRVFAAGKKSI